MLNRIIRIAAALCTLCLAGCAARLGPVDNSDEAIRFTAGSLLLRDDDTKGGTLKESFSNDKFFVWGNKTVGGTKLELFNGQEVSTTNGTVWTYSPIKLWDNTATRYDFLAITGPNSNAGITCTPTGNPLSASVSYNPTESQYDLMAASQYRNNGSTEPVNFLFKHMLSAVSIVIYNDSPSQDITLNSYKFRYLITRGSAIISQNASDVNVSEDWSSPSYNSSLVLGSTNDSPVSLLHGGSQYPASGSPITDLMIPQELDRSGAYIPRLVLDYSYDPGTGTEDVVTPIRLQDIKVKNSEDEYITRWLPGRKYNYEIHIRVGGGIRITVTTTEWEDVYAETPGLTI